MSSLLASEFQKKGKTNSPEIKNLKKWTLLLKKLKLAYFQYFTVET